MPIFDHHRIAVLIERTKTLLPLLTIHVVTNLQDPETPEDIRAPLGLVPRFYYAEEIDEAIRTWQDHGATVYLHYSEKDFISAIPKISECANERTLIYGMADGSTGPGRKALIPALCSLYSLQFLNSDGFSNAFARHKYLNNIAIKAHGIPAPQTWYFRPDTGWLYNISPPKGLEVILKPTYECQSIGITENSLQQADDSLVEKLTSLANAIGQPIAVQEFIEGYELSVPLLTCPEISTPGIVGLSYDGKLNWGRNYRKNADLFGIKRIEKVPFTEFGANFNNALAQEARRVFSLMGFCGTARIDFRVRENHQFYVMDINESPSPIRLDPFYIAFSNAGFSFSDMLVAFIGATLSVRPGFKDPPQN